MTTTEQLFVLREQHIQWDVLRFRHRNDQQALLVRPIIQVEAVIISKCAGDGERAFLVGRYKSFQIINLRIVAIKRDAKAGISFSQLPNVQVAEKKLKYDEARFLPGVLNLLEIHERKSDIIALDEKNRTRACRVKVIL